MRKPRADQKEQLKSWQTELAESRQQLAATREVLDVINSSRTRAPGVRSKNRDCRKDGEFSIPGVALGRVGDLHGDQPMVRMNKRLAGVLVGLAVSALATPSFALVDDDIFAVSAAQNAGWRTHAAR